MKISNLRLARFAVALLLTAVAITTASSQTRRKTTPIEKKSTSTSDATREAFKSDEIRCRGYGRPGGSAFVFFTVNSRSSPTGETIVTYEIAFTPGTRAAGSRGEGLQPGDCAYVDRPISESGPYRIRFETVANAQLKQALHGTPIDRSPTAAERYPDAQTIPEYLKDPNHYWSFLGISQSGNVFIAGGHKFWKPGVLVVQPSDSINDTRRPSVIKPE
jgi:hypothetical protein